MLKYTVSHHLKHVAEDKFSHVSIFLLSDLSILSYDAVTLQIRDLSVSVM